MYCCCGTPEQISFWTTVTMPPVPFTHELGLDVDGEVVVTDEFKEFDIEEMVVTTELGTNILLGEGGRRVLPTIDIELY